MAPTSATSAGSHLWVRGPATQQAAPPPATPLRPKPGTPLKHPPSPHRGHHTAWVNAHGGGGASTLAHLLGGADLGRRWPEPAHGEPANVLLVARTHAAGLQAASRALNALRTADHPPGIHLIALVLVADAPGRLPRPLGQRVRILRSATEVHRILWIPTLRLGEKTDTPPKQLRTLAQLLTTPPTPARRPR
ncbi:DUF6668 family protein [Streptomyces sp. NRRL S-813]|uniref:DUF6668 family protein n=1 Tax=Streptomyces sp. NRRL S-813 TaxID=1463919 RepID=UPI00099C2699|nr:DUF6668 family protein [Streptomyces sp. NRRL S-813]